MAIILIHTRCLQSCLSVISAPLTVKVVPSAPQTSCSPATNSACIAEVQASEAGIESVIANLAKMDISANLQQSEHICKEKVLVDSCTSVSTSIPKDTEEEEQIEIKSDEESDAETQELVSALGNLVMAEDVTQQEDTSTETDEVELVALEDPVKSEEQDGEMDDEDLANSSLYAELDDTPPDSIDDARTRIQVIEVPYEKGLHVSLRCVGGLPYYRMVWRASRYASSCFQTCDASKVDHPPLQSKQTDSAAPQGKCALKHSPHFIPATEEDGESAGGRDAAGCAPQHHLRCHLGRGGIWHGQARVCDLGWRRAR